MPERVYDAGNGREDTNLCHAFDKHAQLGRAEEVLKGVAFGEGAVAVNFACYLIPLPDESGAHHEAAFCERPCVV